MKFSNLIVWRYWWLLRQVSKHLYVIGTHNITEYLSLICYEIK